MTNRRFIARWPTLPCGFFDSDRLPEAVAMAERQAAFLTGSHWYVVDMHRDGAVVASGEATTLPPPLVEQMA